MRRFCWAALVWLTCFLMAACGGGAVGPTSNQDGDLDGVNADSDLHADLDHEDTSQEQAEDSPDSEPPSDGDRSPPDGDTEAELDAPLDGDNADGDSDQVTPTDGDADLPTESDIAGCTAGAVQCTPDGYGFEACGLDAEAGVNSFGTRIPCAPNQECESGVCSRDGCLESEVLFLLDRSASMNQSGAWAWVKPAFTAALDERDHVNYFGFRQFPQGECTAGAVVPLAKNNAATIAAAITDPTVASATPIADALSGLALDFGDPNDGQAVVLITDGEETCGTQADAVQAASALFRAGVRVYVVAVTTTANRTFLNQLAQVGGTGTSRLVRDGEEFAAVLDSVIGEIGARRCAPDNVCCETDGCVLADPSVVCAAYADTCNAAACNEAAGACFADPEPKEGVGCNDGALCTYDDQCQGGVCKGQSVTCSNDAGVCGAQRACNGTAQCTVTYPDASTGCDDGNLCTYGDHCNGAGQCQGTPLTCQNDTGTCGATRTCNGTSACTVVFPGSSTSCQSASSLCNNFDFHNGVCDGHGACVLGPSNCLIDGNCYSNGASREGPGQPYQCQWCDVSVSRTSWSNKPSTASCYDGTTCTVNDYCSGEGWCVSGPYICK